MMLKQCIAAPGGRAITCGHNLLKPVGWLGRNQKDWNMRIFITLAVLLAMIPGRLAALQINLTYDTNGQANSIPLNDPQGTQLMFLAQAAADHWEDIIEDAHTLNVIVRYDNGIPTNLIGQWTGTVQANG